MFNKFEDFETLAIILYGLLFHFLENKYSHRENRRMHFIKSDIIAFVVLILSVSFSRFVLKEIFSLPIFNNYLSIFSLLWELPSYIKIFLGIFICDFVLYWVHRIMHASDLLWKTHEWHHSSEHLYWISGFRTSFLHAFIYAIPQVFIAFYLLNLSFVELVIAFGFIGVFFQIWTHVNLTIDIGFLDKIFITPQYHRMHHAKSGWQRKNFGTYFVFWDKLFGTYVNPKSNVADYDLGLNKSRSLWRMLLGL